MNETELSSTYSLFLFDIFSQEIRRILLGIPNLNYLEQLPEILEITFESMKKPFFFTSIALNRNSFSTNAEGVVNINSCMIYFNERHF